MITGHRATITATVADVPDMVDIKGRPFEPGEISSWWEFHPNGYWYLGGVIIRGKAVLAGTPRRVGTSERFMSFDTDGEWRPPVSEAPGWVAEFLRFEPTMAPVGQGNGR